MLGPGPAQSCSQGEAGVRKALFAYNPINWYANDVLFFRTHDDAAIITSLTGIGDALGAEFLALVGGSLAWFASADHLAGYPGLARLRLPHWQTYPGRSATTGNCSAPSTPQR